MPKFIEQLYYGNIDPQARSTGQNKTIKKQMASLIQSEECLKSVLSGELKDKFVAFDQAWSAVDLTMGVMVVINVATLWFLRNDVKRLYADYMKQRAAGLDPVFDPGTLPERADILDGWKKI